MSYRDWPVTAAQQDAPDGAQRGIRCPGCGGVNSANALACDWCGRDFASPAHRLRVAGWQLVSTILILAVVGAIVTLGVLNANRVLPELRPAATAVAVASVAPTPAVTPRVTAGAIATSTPARTPTPTQTRATGASGLGPTPAPTATATPAPRREAVIGGTGGQGVILRAEPGPQAPALTALRDGTRVLLTGNEQAVAARLWREIEEPTRGVTGWVAAEFLQAP